MSAFDKISASEFADKLARYTPLIESISALKGGMLSAVSLSLLSELVHVEPTSPTPALQPRMDRGPWPSSMSIATARRWSSSATSPNPGGQ